MATSSEADFELRGISVRYGPVPALHDLSLRIHAGERLGLLGPNGAGKSTLLRTLCRLVEPCAGTIRFRGASVDRWDRRAFARQVAFLPQQARILFPFTVWEVVAMGRAPHQAGTYFESAADRARIAAALELAGCSHLSARPFQELSGGEQQLVCLAAALAQDPKVLLLDEPTVFLDLNHQLQVFEVLNQLHRKDGLTLVVVTHDLNLARFCCDRLVLLRSGQLRAEVRDPARGIPAELLSDVFEVPAARLEPFPGVIPERRSAP